MEENANASGEPSGQPAAVPGLTPRRIETLADSVFAIAMTLLVLDLRVPEVLGSRELLSALVGMWPKFVSFVLGFVLLGTVWVNHHYQFHFIRRADRMLLWVNLFLLMVASALPFGVAVLGHHWANSVATALYGAFMLAAGSCLYANWTYATRSRRLVDGALSEAAVQAMKARIRLGLVGYGLAFVSAFVWPVGSIILYFLMPLLYLAPARIDRLVRP